MSPALYRLGFCDSQSICQIGDLGGLLEVERMRAFTSMMATAIAINREASFLGSCPG